MPTTTDSSTTTDKVEDLQHRLAALLADTTGDPSVRIDGLHRLPAGASRHTWSFELSGDDTERQGLILRMDAPGGLEADAMGRETALMVAAGAAGVPSPVCSRPGAATAPSGRRSW